ncbi:MAG: HD-GYP domain-containing protein [Lachnospiraceae bacterium]|nr:HD-GYP domain-containing protein [Lachnospiraceae bacterium]
MNTKDPKYALCISYNWSDFRAGLVNKILLTIVVNIFVMIICGGLLLFLLYRIAIKPVKVMQKSVREYEKTKESKSIVEDLMAINSRNEFEWLANDIMDLSIEMDSHIKEIKDAREKMVNFNAEVMEALAQTIDAKDKYTNGHSSRVAKYSKMIAAKMGMSEDTQTSIYYMGLLHDIGKIGIPDEIINKTSKLTDEEYNLIQSHPLFGYDILSRIPSHPELAQAARWHHEMYDGTGYPDKISGENIPLHVRIIAVADSYDAMASNRSYRKYLPQDVIRKEIADNIGTQFDPECAKCMLEIIDEDTEYKLHEE